MKDVGTDIGMESTDKQAIRKYLRVVVWDQRYYGWSEDYSEFSSSDTESEQGDLNDAILDVQNIADSVLFISLSMVVLNPSYYALKQPLHVAVNEILIEPLRRPL